MTKLNIDLLPYEIHKVSPQRYEMPDFPWDIRVPDRYQNRRGGDYCLLNGDNESFAIYQNDDNSVIIHTFRDMGNNEFMEEFESAISNNYDALNEIGWEALGQDEI